MKYLFAFLIALQSPLAHASFLCEWSASQLYERTPHETRALVEAATIRRQKAELKKFEEYDRMLLGAFPHFARLPGFLQASLRLQYGRELGIKMFQAYESIRQLMTDRVRFFRELQALELRNVLELHRRGLPETPENLARVLDEVLAAHEKELGFGPVREITEPDLPSDAFREILRSGRPISDLAYGGTAHGSRVHRLQLYVWSRMIAREAPSLPILLYRELGNLRTARDLDWYATEHPQHSGHLWYPLFDSEDPHLDFSRPYLFYLRRSQFPGLGTWN